MKLTAKHFRAAAAASRELASEFAEGRGPSLKAWTWCGCAAAEIVKRAGIVVPNGDLDRRVGEAAREIEFYTDGFDSPLLTFATNHELNGMPGALVFPLLYAADRMELAAQPPSSASASLAGHEQDKET